MLETFLEAILWKPYQLFRRIMNDVSNITKAPFLQCWFQSREQVPISWSQAGGSSGVVTLFFAKKSLTKTDRYAGTISWSRNQLWFPHFSWIFRLADSLRRRRMSKYISLLKVVIHVNYSREFREHSEATAYYCDRETCRKMWYIKKWGMYEYTVTTLNANYHVKLKYLPESLEHT